MANEGRLWARCRQRRIGLNGCFQDRLKSRPMTGLGRNRSFLGPLVLLVVIVLSIVGDAPTCTDHQLVADQDVRAT